MTNHDKLLKVNNLAGLEIDKQISKDHPYNDEVAILRKEIHHIEQALNISPTEEFAQYYTEAESKKAEVKARLT